MQSPQIILKRFEVAVGECVCACVNMHAPVLWVRGGDQMYSALMWGQSLILKGISSGRTPWGSRGPVGEACGALELLMLSRAEEKQGQGAGWVLGRGGRGGLSDPQAG